MSFEGAVFHSHMHSRDELASKAFMDLKYGPAWHCIVGSDFKAFVTHESKHFVFFYVGKIAICLYKAG